MAIRNPHSKFGFSLNVFTEDELCQIHSSTLEVLWHTGVRITNSEALDIFEDGGAMVDRQESIVRIYPYMIEEAIRSAPSTIVLYGRNRANDIILDGSRVNFTTFGAGVQIVDANTGELRRTTKEDVGQTALISDYLDAIDIYSQAVSACDCQGRNVDLHEAEAFLSNTSKHCMHQNLTGSDNIKKYLKMGAAVLGGMDELRRRPIISAQTCPQSPLQLHNECCEVIIELAREMIPVNILSMAMAGATAPVTIAGMMVVHNCEVLTGVLLSQLVNKGAPVLYGGSSTIFDMLYATSSVGSPELGMCSAGVAALAQFYLLPSFVAGA